MAKTDSPLNDLLIAFHLLTRLPLPGADWSSQSRPHARAAWAYPLVGIVIGGIAALTAWIALWLGLSVPLASLIALGTMIITTGAMHEDGLADCADGFWGGWEIGRRLEIMKDSQIGTYGVLALLVILGAKWLALCQILNSAPIWTLIIAPVASRALMVPVMELLPHARDSGLSRSTGQPGQAAVWGALAIGLLALFSLGMAIGLALIAVASGSTIVLSILAKRKIGGQTGDVLGAVQSLGDTVLLITLSAVFQ